MSVDALTVRPPFQVVGVDKVEVALKASPREEVVSGFSCRRAVLTFSYNLTLGIKNSTASFPARVEGTEDFCLMEASDAPRLPFGHRLGFTSGHATVDAAVADRLASLKGIPVARMLKVTRRIENGEPVSAASALILSDIREGAVSPQLFEVPSGYRFQEPLIVAPARRHP